MKFKLLLAAISFVPVMVIAQQAPVAPPVVAGMGGSNSGGFAKSAALVHYGNSLPNVDPQLQARDGLITIGSAYSVRETVDRFKKSATDKDFTIFNQIDHAKGAEQIGKNLRPTELLIFGNPAGGTPLMESTQIVAIDLPMKALFWEDQSGNTFLTYNDPQYLAARHQIICCEDILLKLSRTLKELARLATQES